MASRSSPRQGASSPRQGAVSNPQAGHQGTFVTKAAQKRHEEKIEAIAAEREKLVAQVFTEPHCKLPRARLTLGANPLTRDLLARL